MCRRTTREDQRKTLDGLPTPDSLLLIFAVMTLEVFLLSAFS